MTLEVITYAVAGTLQTSLSSGDVTSMLTTGVPREAGIRFPESCETEVDDIVIVDSTITMTVTTPLRQEQVGQLIEEAITKETLMKHPGSSCSIDITSINIVP